jgi:hypothetical protein
MSDVFAALLGATIMLILVAMRRHVFSFRGQGPQDLANRGPAFDMKHYLSGPILCEGVIYGPTGRVASRFVAEMEGSWDGDTGTLRETFRYDSGSVQNRKWTLHLNPDGTIRAEAPDVVGSGTGRASGAGVQMKYRLRLTEDAGGHVLDVIDWMYLMENGTIMNRSQFTKFGFTVAELVATMRRVPVAQ